MVLHCYSTITPFLFLIRMEWGVMVGGSFSFRIQGLPAHGSGGDKPAHAAAIIQSEISRYFCLLFSNCEGDLDFLQVSPLGGRRSVEQP